ncbi:MAG: hypothetical protein AB4080_09825 [Trichodesmium sp.]
MNKASILEIKRLKLLPVKVMRFNQQTLTRVCAQKQSVGSIGRVGRQRKFEE